MPERAAASLLRPETQYYGEKFREAQAGVFANEPSWLADARRKAIGRFETKGFPTFRDEEWKYTSLSSLAKIPFVPARPGATKADARVKSEALDRAIAARLATLAFHHDAISLVFVDGRFFEARGAKANGLTIHSLAGTLRDRKDSRGLGLDVEPGIETDGVKDLNASFFGDGAMIHVARGQTVAELIHLVYVSTSGAAPGAEAPAAYLRNEIRLDAGAQARIVETYLGLEPGVHLTNAVTQLELAEDAVLDHTKIQDESRQAFHFGEVRVHQAARSSLRSFVFSIGGAVARNEVRTVLDGEGAECILNGLYAASAKQHVDNLTLIDHAKPGCTSRETYRGAIDGSARGIFNGKVLVRAGAQKTSAEQSNRNLLLSPDATANTRPQLQIYADDVKCTHGATVGRIDEEALFYLRSRGIGAAQARILMTQAFAAEVIDRIAAVTVRESVRKVFEEWLRAGGEAHGD